MKYSNALLQSTTQCPTVTLSCNSAEHIPQRCHDSRLLVQVIQHACLASLRLVATQLAPQHAAVRVLSLEGQRFPAQQLDGNSRFPPLPQEHPPKGALANQAGELELRVGDLPRCRVQPGQPLNGVSLRAAAGVARPPVRAAAVVRVHHVLIARQHALPVLDLRCHELSVCRHAEVPTALPVAQGNASAAAGEAQKLHLSSVLHQVLSHSAHGFLGAFCTVQGLHHKFQAAPTA